MNELISGFVGKDCIVYISASSGTSINGVITSLNENWIIVKTAGGEEVINLDYVIRVKEHPVGKNGKKKKDRLLNSVNVCMGCRVCGGSLSKKATNCVFS